VDVVIEDAFPGVGGQDGRGEDDGEGDWERVGRGGRGGRKSRVDAALAKVAGEDEEEDDDQEDEHAQSWRPQVRLTFHGPHVFAGIRQLVECGIIDGERMPGWMTGEEGVTIGAVRNGRIRGYKGSGV
jgi:central kinetochore subunit Mis15/CHL4